MKTDILIFQIKSEINFLRSKNIRWLVHKADLGACHMDYQPIKRRIKKLRLMLKRLKE